VETIGDDVFGVLQPFPPPSPLALLQVLSSLDAQLFDALRLLVARDSYESAIASARPMPGLPEAPWWAAGKPWESSFKAQRTMPRADYACHARCGYINQPNITRCPEFLAKSVSSVAGGTASMVKE